MLCWIALFWLWSLFFNSQILPKINISKKTSVVYELICDDGSFKAKFNIKNHLNPSQNDSNFELKDFPDLTFTPCITLFLAKIQLTHLRRKLQNRTDANAERFREFS